MITLRRAQKKNRLTTQSTHRVATAAFWSVSVSSAGAHTSTLYVMVNIVDGKYSERGVCVHPPTHTSLGQFFHHDGMDAKKRPSPLCVYLCGKAVPVMPN